MTEKKPGDKRRTTVHDRYTVECSLCGLIDYGFTSFDKATTFALQKLWRHANHGQVTIFDVMAHQGKPNHWEVDSCGYFKVIGRK